MTSARHWPVVQRRKLEKLKDERLQEFERTCLESFDWLENYYQGCVYAAQQNRDFHDQPPSRSSYGSPLSTSKLSYTTIHGADENPVTPTRTVYSSQGRDFYTADELSFLGMEAQDSPRKRTPRSKESMGQYRLKSPRIPASMALNQSPRSPFERNHYSHRKSHLRVDASAATRRARRALKALQRESIQPSSRNNASSENQLNRTDKTEQDFKAPSEKTLQSATDPTYVLPPPPPPLTTTSNTDTHMEDPSLTPVKRPRSLVQSSRTLGTHFRSRRTEEAESPGDFEPTPTPVLRARDSMTLISPVSRTPGRHLSRGSTASTSYSEDTRQKSTTPIHSRERTPAVDRVDTEEDPPESKRPRVSSFLDSMAPVRFNSPVPNSAAQSGSHADKAMDPYRIRSSVGSAESKASSQSILSRERVFEAHHLESGATQTPRQTSSGSTAVHRSMTPINGDKLVKSETALSNSPNPLKRSTAAAKVGTDNHEEQTLQALRGSNTRADPANKSLKDTKAMDSKAASSEALTGRAATALDTTSRSSTGYQKRNDEQSIPGDSTESESLQRTRAKLNPGRDNTANITASQSVYAPPKPRVGLTLQEKRTIGQRTKPISASSLQQLSSTQSQMPPSRLTKTISSLSAPGTTSQDYEGRPAQSMATNQKIGTTSLTGDLSTSSVFGLVNRNSTTHGDTIHSGYLGQSSETAATTHQRATLLRGGLSVAKKPSESTLLRTESHGSLSRKPFISTKSAFALKRPARPVLPDGTLTSKVLASVLSASASSSASSSSTSSKPTSILVKMNGSVKSTSSLDTKGVTEARSGSTLVQTRQEPQPSTTSTGHSSKSFVETSLSLSSSLLSSKAQSGSGSGSVHMAPLPDIPSDNEDEDIMGHPSSQDASGPRWASWEEMEQAMHNQVHLNPIDVFGPLPALDIDEIFPVRSKPEPARARSSSAHWGVADRLTTREIIKYNEDMGWGNNDSLI
ncbi:hypothetical protein BGW38_003991 [Lunasporangiospora selenospora]|uniref:Inner centromere protein ARK-binding domain-containing protein n=1 Tax=Lunasporangiospora selenospora TaxID=979761 RepID=A0A9P6FPW2_9FUNG|nr:hypothetical protein BGW38_003991 [Lunasporangiospora selenospora]